MPVALVKSGKMCLSNESLKYPPYTPTFKVLSCARPMLGRDSATAPAAPESIKVRRLSAGLVSIVIVTSPASRTEAELWIASCLATLLRNRLCVNPGSWLPSHGGAEDHEAQDLEQELRTCLRGVRGCIVLRRHLDDIAANDVNSLEAAEQGLRLTGR